MISDELVFGIYFNGGLRVHDIRNPFRPELVAYFIPEAPVYSPGLAAVQENPAPGINLNDVYVDEAGIIYTVDRYGGGLYILELTL